MSLKSLLFRESDVINWGYTLLWTSYALIVPILSIWCFVNYTQILKDANLITTSIPTSTGFLKGFGTGILCGLSVYFIINKSVGKDTEPFPQKWKWHGISKYCIALILAIWIPMVIAFWPFERGINVSIVSFIAILGGIIGISRYYRYYLLPMEFDLSNLKFAETELKKTKVETWLESLRLEYQEYISTLRWLSRAITVVLVSGVVAYMTKFPDPEWRKLIELDFPKVVKSLGTVAVQVLYLALGVFLALIDPIHGRLKQIRLQIKEISDTL